MGGIVNATYNNSDLVIPLTNAEAKAAFDYADGVTLGNDGVQDMACLSTTNVNKTVQDRFLRERFSAPCV